MESPVFLGIEEAGTLVETVVGTSGRRVTEGVADGAGIATDEEKEEKPRTGTGIRDT
jgi:hypothetical protein